MKKNKKKLIIIALFIVTLGMGIGYSILSKQLKIEGTASLETNFDVAITGIEKVADDIYRRYEPAEDVGMGAIKQVEVPGVIENSAPTYTSSVANFDVTLKKNSTIIYKVTLKNTGDIDALLESVNVNKTGAEAVSVVAPINYDGAVLTNYGLCYYVILTYDDTKAISDGELSSDISIVFNTKQKTVEESSSPNPFNFLTIGDNIVEDGKIVGVKLNEYSTILGGGVGEEDLLISIDGSEYTSVGQFEGKYIFPTPEIIESGDGALSTSMSKHIVKLKLQNTTEVTLELWY